MKDKQTTGVGQKQMLCLLPIFLAAVAIRFLLCQKNTTLGIYFDELRYWSLAGSLFSGEGIAIHHMAVPYQKLFTALTYLPAYFASGAQARLHAALFINCLWMASGIFPLWILCRKVLKSVRLSAVAVAIYLISPDFASTATLMSESNHVPLVLWYFVLVWMALDMQSGRRKNLFLFGMGSFCWLLYFAKETAVAYALSWAALAGIQLLARRFENWRKSLIECACYAAGFVLPLLLLKATLFRGMGNSYHQSGLDALLVSGAIHYFVYAALMQLICACVAFFVLPVFIPALCWKKLSRQEQGLYFYAIISLCIFCAAISYTISIRESLGLLAIRPYTRYFSGISYVLLILFLRSVELLLLTETQLFSKQTLLCGAAVPALVAVLGRDCSLSCCADSFLLNYLVYIPSLFSPAKLPQALKAAQKLPAFLPVSELLQSGAITPFFVGKAICVTIAVAFGVLLYLLSRRNKGFLPLFTALVVMISLVNNVVSYAAVRLNCSISDEEAAQSGAMAMAVKELDGTVVCLQGSIQANLVDTYFDLPNVYPALIDDLAESDAITLTMEDLIEPYSAMVYNLEGVDYILVMGEHEAAPVQWNVENAKQLDVPGAEGYLLYQNLDPAKIVLSSKAS